MHIDPIKVLIYATDAIYLIITMWIWNLTMMFELNIFDELIINLWWIS